MSNEILTQLKQKDAELAEQIEALRKEYSNNVKLLFKQGFEDLFERHPNIESVKWNQYTPYFNDRDTCKFNVHYDYLCEDNFTLMDEDLPYPTEDEIDEFTTFLGQFSNKIYMDLFDDHVEVVVYRDGRVVVTEYDHD
jgi:hypothetical protein